MGTFKKVASALIVLLLIAGGIFLLIQFISDLGRFKTSLNISRSDYEAALAKWQSRGGDKYEMIVETEGMGCLRCGTYQLLINGSDLVIENFTDTMDYSLIGIPVPTPAERSHTPFASAGGLEYVTVSRLFASVDQLLLDHDVWCHGYLYGTADSVEFTVRFDPQLGYPSLIKEEGKRAFGAASNGSRECPLGYSTKVHSLTILK